MKVEREAWKANDYTRKQIIQEAERVIENFEMMGHRFKNGRLQKEWDECRPDSWLAEPEQRPPCL